MAIEIKGRTGKEKGKSGYTVTVKNQNKNNLYGETSKSFTIHTDFGLENLVERIKFMLKEFKKNIETR